MRICPESRLDLALLFARRKDVAQAEAQLKEPLLLDPTFVPAAVNLADLVEASAGTVTVKRPCAPPCSTDLPILHLATAASRDP
jgi:hypothetical protein